MGLPVVAAERNMFQRAAGSDSFAVELIKEKLCEVHRP
jgi:hypothetical protein